MTEAKTQAADMDELCSGQKGLGAIEKIYNF